MVVDRWMEPDDPVGGDVTEKNIALAGRATYGKVVAPAVV